jgi:hypothetical protein
MTNPDAWRAFLATPVSGDAKVLALFLATHPHTPEPATHNVRILGESLRMTPVEYERAFHELRDPRVGWLDSAHLDRPQLKADASPRALFVVESPVNKEKKK